VRVRAALVAAGTLLMGYALVGVLTDPGVSPGGVLIFLAGVLVVHDVVWMALVLAAGAVIVRFVPRGPRPAVRIAAIIVAALAVVAVPLILGSRP
jgi:threonine/homoserine/homoserine lactone efflux protein